MKTSLKTLAVFTAIASVLLCTSAAQAERDDTIFARHCGYYHSARDFVQKASLYCISKSNRSETKSCVEQAKAYFQQCSYRGDYERISTEVHAGVLFMLVLAGAPEVSRGHHES